MGKKIVPIFKAKIEDGKMSFIPDNEEMTMYLRSLENGIYSIKVWHQGKERTNKQHGLYWLYLNMIEKEGMGNAEELHEYFKRVHLQPVIIEVMGKEMAIPNSTKNLSTSEFSDYLSKIYMETNVPIPSLDLWDLT
jgi:hypothetical protein